MTTSRGPSGSMPFLVDSPVARRGAATPSLKAHATEVVLREDAAAERRFLIARTAAQTVGGLSAKAAAIRVLIEQAGVMAGPVPSASTISHLERQWRAGKRSSSDYRPKRKSGRPKMTLDPRIMAIIASTAQTTPKMSVRQLHRAIKKFCRKTGTTAPSYRTIQSRYLETVGGMAGHAAALHGSRASQMDATPRSTFPVEHTHDVWVIDEVTLPVHAKMRVDDAWVSIRPDAVVVSDLKSRAIIGYVVADPGRRRDPATGARKRGGFDQDDVLGALASAACREVASFGTQTFAGFLPTRELRWDRAAGHRALLNRLTTGEKTADGITIPGLRLNVVMNGARRPDRNGTAERINAALKSLLAGTVGHVDLHIPSDDASIQRGVSPKTMRTTAAVQHVRAPYQDVVAVEDLLTVAQLAGVVGGAVNAYNTEHVHSAHGLTPAEAYHEHLPDRHAMRRGRDLVAIFPTTTVSLAKGGLIVGHWGRPHRFAWQVDGWQLTMNASVTVRVDPLARGVFAVVHGRTLFLPNLRTWAKDRSGLDYAKSMTAAAQILTAPTRAARAEFLEFAIGADGLERSITLAAQLDTQTSLWDSDAEDAVRYRPGDFELVDDEDASAHAGSTDDPVSADAPGDHATAAMQGLGPSAEHGASPRTTSATSPTPGVMGLTAYGIAADHRAEGGDAAGTRPDDDVRHWLNDDLWL